MTVALQHKRLVAWLGTIALLCNVLAGAFGYGPAKHMATVADEILGELIICTSDGAKQAGLDSGGVPIHNPADHCPACIVLAQVALAVIVVLVAIAFPLVVAARPGPVRARALAVHLSLGGIGSRAPPLFA